LATACWAFIVAKTTRAETASLLDFASLHLANSDLSTQVINMFLLMTWGYFGTLSLVNSDAVKLRR